MSYCTEQDMIGRFGELEMIQLSDVEGAGVIDSDRIAEAIGDAGAIIDTRIGSRYALPLASVPPVLTRIACDLARYYLYDDEVPEPVARRREDALAFLEAVAAGDLSLGIDASGAQPESTAVATIQSGGNVFNRKDKSFI